MQPSPGEPTSVEQKWKGVIEKAFKNLKMEFEELHTKLHKDNHKINVKIITSHSKKKDHIVEKINNESHEIKSHLEKEVDKIDTSGACKPILSLSKASAKKVDSAATGRNYFRSFFSQNISNL